MGANAQQKSAYKKRNGICKRIGSGLVNQSHTFEQIEVARAEAVIGSTLAALDRYLATVIGSPAARAAMDSLKLANARAA
jgi:hypothetical protein